MDESEEHDSIDVLMEQHRAVLEYERLVDSQQWSAIDQAYPGGPPVCACVICRQLDALSDRLVTLTRSVRRYEHERSPAKPGCIDIVQVRRRPELDATCV